MNNISKKFFKDRIDSAKQLIDVLPIDNMKLEKWIVIATSSSGVPIAYEIKKELDSEFDFMFTEKVFAPNNNECEIAIVTESEEVVIHEEVVKAFEISLDYIYSEAKQIYHDKITAHIKRYRDDEQIIDMHEKNVLLVDEGLNTGLTMMACIKTAINLGAKSVSVAVPILPEVTVGDIESIADDLYFAKVVPHFVSIDFYYENLEEITLEDIKKTIK